jgi:hypothetical protein
MPDLKSKRPRQAKVKGSLDARHQEATDGSSHVVLSNAQPLERQITFEDYLRPNRFIPNWLYPYLPSEPRVRDYVFLGRGFVVFWTLGAALHWIGINDLVSFAIPMAGLAVLGGDLEVRYMIAGARFARAKKLASRV